MPPDPPSVRALIYTPLLSNLTTLNLVATALWRSYIHTTMPELRPGWTDQRTSSPLQDIKLCKIYCQQSSSSSLQPMLVSHSLKIASDLTWKPTILVMKVLLRSSHNHRFRVFLGISIPSHSVHYCCFSTQLEYVQGIQRSNFSRSAQKEREILIRRS